LGGLVAGAERFSDYRSESTLRYRACDDRPGPDEHDALHYNHNAGSNADRDPGTNAFDNGPVRNGPGSGGSDAFGSEPDRHGHNHAGSDSFDNGPVRNGPGSGGNDAFGSEPDRHGHNHAGSDFNDSGGNAFNPNSKRGSGHERATTRDHEPEHDHTQHDSSGTAEHR
jgi:hypothetical protein